MAIESDDNAATTEDRVPASSSFFINFPISFPFVDECYFLADEADDFFFCLPPHNRDFFIMVIILLVFVLTCPGFLLNMVLLVMNGSKPDIF